MEEIEIKEFKNRKPDEWYNDFFKDWIRNYYFGFYSLEECIQLQKEYDERIDNDTYLEYLSKYKIQGYKEFITENNSFGRNKEIIDSFKQLLLIFKSKEEFDDDNLYLGKLIENCLLIFKQGFLVTNQLFILHDWFSTLGEYGDIGDSYPFSYKKRNDIGDLF